MNLRERDTINTLKRETFCQNCWSLFSYKNLDILAWIKPTSSLIMKHFFNSCIMDNNAMFAAQQAQYNRMYAGLDSSGGR